MNAPINTADTLTAIMLDMGVRARAAAKAVRDATTEVRNAALTAMAQAIREDAIAILAANARDMVKAETDCMSAPMKDRLRLDEARLEAIAAGVDAIAAQPEPLGEVMADWTRPNGLNIRRVRIPVGIIGIIYESRPNVTADAGALCIRSGNCVILRGGSDAFESSKALVTALQRGLLSAGLPADAIQLVGTTDRAAVGSLLSGLNGSIDMIIPRGGKSLVARVQAEARVPVLSHLEGLCHTYVHAGADLEKAVAVTVNAKLRRTGICGSTETLLVDASVAEAMLPVIASALVDKGCELRAEPRAATVLTNAGIASTPATDDDFRTEHLAAIISVAVVDDINAAIAHIGHYGSGHTDCIITEDPSAAEQFLNEVDSAIVLVNASTQYADGGEFGFGAEIGIGTGRLHARGPVGAEGLTTYKYQVRGTGQVRP
jgi:glutamate-5-semialdehyde dehydrogenase